VVALERARGERDPPGPLWCLVPTVPVLDFPLQKACFRRYSECTKNGAIPAAANGRGLQASYTSRNMPIVRFA